MKNIIILAVAVFLTVSVQAQKLEVKNVFMVSFQESDFYYDVLQKTCHFGVAVPVVPEGRLDSVVARLDHRILKIELYLSADRLVSRPKTKMLIQGEVKTVLKKFDDMEYYVVTTILNQPKYCDVAVLDQAGTDVTPPRKNK